MSTAEARHDRLEQATASMKLSEIAGALSAEIIGDRSLDIRRIVHPADALEPGDLAIGISKDGYAALASSPAEAILVPATAPRPPRRAATIVVSGEERAILARLTALFDKGPERTPGIHSSAVIAPDAVIGAGVSIGPLAVIGPRSSIGNRSVILAQVTVGADAVIGADCLIHPGARIADRVRIGDRVIIHANASLGSDGFSFIPVRAGNGSAAAGLPVRTHSLGSVVIGDDVEIGAGVTIDRGTLRDTRIGRGTKIDNLVQIGHNVVIGESCLICGEVGISGSAVIGDRVLLGGGAGVADHVSIGSDAMVAASSGVAARVPAGARVAGTPAVPMKKWTRRLLEVGRLPALYRKVDDMATRVEILENAVKRD